MGKPRLLVIGGGFAGVMLAKLSSDFADVTLVDPKQYVEITWATVRGIVNSSVAERSIINFKDIPGLGRCVQASVVRLDAKEARLSNGETIPFDYAAVCTGTSYSESFKSAAATTREQRLAEMKAVASEIRAAKSIAVVGGGPAGVEAAAEIVEAFAGKALTLVAGSKRLLPALPPKAGDQAHKWLAAHGVKVLLESRVESRPQGRGPTNLALSGGQSLAADLVLWCGGGQLVAASILAGGQLARCLDERGAIKVGPTLQVEGHPHVFALGDCNNVPEMKKGFLAQEHAKLAAKSLKALITAGHGKAPKLGVWKPEMGMAPMMILSVGPRWGICAMGGTVITGCLPTNMKSKTLFVDKTRAGLGVKG